MDSKVPAELLERAKVVNGTPKDEGRGYWSLVGKTWMGTTVVYVAVPANHPLKLVPGSVRDMPVHGDCTFHDNRVFGWDYGHFADMIFPVLNPGDVSGRSMFKTPPSDSVRREIMDCVWWFMEREEHG